MDAWKQILTGNRELKPCHRVCERHFDRTDISTHWYFNINGSLHLMERGKPRLTNDAVPRFFLESLKTAKALKPLKKVRINFKRKPEPKTPEEVAVSLELQIDAVDTQTTELPEEVTEDLSEDDETMNQEPESALLSCESIADSADDGDARDAPGDSKIDRSDDDKTLAKKQSIFNSLYDDVFEVELPCTRYGVHRDPERTFIAFSLFDPSSWSAIRVLHIDNRLFTRIVHKGVVTSEVAHEDLTVDTVSEMLNQMDST